MATLKSSTYQEKSNDQLDRISLGNVTQNLEGGGVCWDIDSVSLAHAAVITVMHYDSGRFGEYQYGGPNLDRKPHIIIKGSANFATYNVTVKDEDANTLYTFDADCSTTPRYVVLRLISTDRNTVSWELA